MSAKSASFQAAFDHDNKTLAMAAMQEDPTWAGRVPDLSKQAWSDLGVAIASDKFTPLRNAIFNSLVNRIGETIIQLQDFYNPLNVFKRGTMLYGDTVQEIATDTIKARRFIGGADTPIGQEPNQFQRAPNDVVAAYHTIQREDQYQITIDDFRMRQAFIDPRGLYSLLDEKVAMLEKSNIVDEFIYAKKLLTEFYNEGGLQSGQLLATGDLTAGSSVEDVRQWLIKVKTRMRMMNYNSRGYTKTNIMTSTAPDDMVIILRADIPVINEVSNLSQAFHAEYMDIDVPIIAVDFFTDDFTSSTNIVGIICDRRAFFIKENYRSMTTADNAMGLYRNYFFTISQLYAASPLKPVIYLVKTIDGIKGLMATKPIDVGESQTKAKQIG